MKTHLPETANPKDEDWKRFFAQFPKIVIVANNPDVDPVAMVEAHGRDALYCFFNRAFKVLDRPFDCPSLLVARSGVRGANVLRHGNLPKALATLAPDTFQGVVNLKGRTIEQFSTPVDFDYPGRSVPVRQLDLSSFLEAGYPAGKTATSGFALAVWLLDMKLGSQPVLYGFSAKRSRAYKLFDAHDWTIEQTILRLLAADNAIVMDGPGKVGHHDAYARAVSAFVPDNGAKVAPMVLGQVISERLSHTDGFVDTLWSDTAVLRSFRVLSEKWKSWRQSRRG